MANSIKKYLLIIIGSLSLALGIIGIFLPVLPTTPFLLLASYCYVRSSKKLYQWLIQHKVFGAYIYNYLTHGAVLKSSKILAFIFLWTGLSISIYLMDNNILRLFLFLIGIGVSVHLYTLKTLKKEEWLKSSDDILKKP